MSVQGCTLPYLSACTRVHYTLPQCLYKGSLYLTSVPVQGFTLPYLSACTGVHFTLPQCLYKGALYLTFTPLTVFPSTSLNTNTGSLIILSHFLFISCSFFPDSSFLFYCEGDKSSTFPLNLLMYIAKKSCRLCVLLSGLNCQTT